MASAAAAASEAAASPPTAYQDHLATTVDTILRTLQEKWIHAAQHVESLERVLQIIQANALGFDAEDVGWVQAALQVAQADKDDCQKDLLFKQSTYEDKVVGARKMLAQRMDALNRMEQETAIFTYNPDLIQKFTQKQVVLTEMVEQAVQQLLD
jgi:hypothetical protein